MTNKLHIIAVWDNTKSDEIHDPFVGEIKSVIDIRKLFKVLSNVGVDLTYTEAGVMKGRIQWVENMLINDKITDLDEETGKFFDEISDKMGESHGRNSDWVAEVQVYAKPNEVFGR